MFIAANTIASTIGKTWKQPRCPSKEDWIKKIWCLYTIEYYLAIKKNVKKEKKNEIASFAATWKHLETIILSEAGQTMTNIT